MAISFKCFEFPKNSFDSILCEELEGLHKERHTVKNKSQVLYIHDYLEYIKCKTILYEHPYIDRDYLEDYSNYYSRCFTGYERHCSRLHFFSTTYDNDYFSYLLNNKITKEYRDALQESYLGFSIINPLPSSFIGRTCLATYEDDHGRRKYKSTRVYKVHLFGIELSVKSLAFQEQDSTVAACATSALWSAFHGSGILFQHAIPSPVEITKLATQYVLHPKRSFPNHDLNFFQITHAIKALGLDPATIPINNNAHYLQANIYAYLSAGIPLLLLLLQPDRGGHAVAVTGFSVKDQKAEHIIPNYPDFLVKSTCIDKVYVHDDQRGPFARVELFDKDGNFQNYNDLPGYSFIYESLIAPVYHKIRIGYDAILIAALKFHISTKILIRILALDDIEICWDIHLSTSIQFKKECFESEIISDEERKRALLKELPRFIWVATATNAIDNEIQFSIIFDATDITNGCLLVHDVEYKFPIMPALIDYFSANDVSQLPVLTELKSWISQLNKEE